MAIKVVKIRDIYFEIDIRKYNENQKELWYPQNSGCRIPLFGRGKTMLEEHGWEYSRRVRNYTSPLLTEGEIEEHLMLLMDAIEVSREEWIKHYFSEWDVIEEKVPSALTTGKREPLVVEKRYRGGKYITVILKPVIRVPDHLIGHVIGKGGRRIQELSDIAGHRIEIQKGGDKDEKKYKGAYKLPRL